MILIIDNYDSFTYNLVQLIGIYFPNVSVCRNDQITLRDIIALKPDCIVISPGPGTPNDSGVSIQIIEQLSSRFPIFGVCLGHQCIGQAFGSRIIRAKLPMHGKVSQIIHNGSDLFSGVPNPFAATRYHSLIIQNETLAPDLEVVAWTEANEIMAIQHRKLPIFGVQFHPESIMTAHGERIVVNFLRSVS